MMDEIQKLRKRVTKLEGEKSLLSEQLKEAGAIARVPKGLAARYIQVSNALTGAQIRLERLELQAKPRG